MALETTQQPAVERTGPVDAPWIVDEINTPNGVAYQVSHLWEEVGNEAGETTMHTDEVCQVCVDYRGTRSLDTAHLIAAAPDLMKACKALIAYDKNGRFGEPDFPAAINMARAAVAKADGRNPAPADLAHLPESMVAGHREIEHDDVL